VEVVHGSIGFSVEEGDAATLAVRDHHFTLTAGAPVTVPLTGQGPQIDGAPALHSGDRRQDGTLILATVPHARSKR
jgi:alpha,alpha-trehalose phosphorylase